MTTWQWDSSLFAGSAAYYARGRIAYPTALVDTLATAAGLDGTGRLLDVGSGPGSLTLPLSHLFREAVAVDADAAMVAEGARIAAREGITNIRWVHLRAEDLPAGLGTFRLVTLAQAFHWMDRATVAAAVRAMLSPDGVCAHVHATTHEGVEDDGLPHPRPPHAGIGDLVRRYLGPVRRAGQGTLPEGTADGEAGIYEAAGFTHDRHFEVPGRVVTRSVDDVVAAVFSLSGSAPHLFGDDLPAFEEELRGLLRTTAADGVFSERVREIGVDLWRP
ncbi:class I SAM-dependent methyltransferase [Saccharothrix violaceirubra]|uniref:SAM-dependent methyltransferase n=1 Tax=Saccharothrix violaceirubra TaxID=413306 RepID=A0A7W7T3X8_9PSEU|nr:class I SAM-dependent methyltransferase [Saccharothrix violaceirubra]MBB4966130.1 SAM-dependent methyltransferase [Saccharothrix violaceirubra]